MRNTLGTACGAGFVILAGTLLCAAPGRAQTTGIFESGGGQEATQTAGTTTSAGAQQSGAVALTLKSAIEMALRNSKDIQVAKLQASLAEHASQVSKSNFMPNLFAGSGAGYTYGIPETPGDELLRFST